MKAVGVVIAARNEEKTISDVLGSLERQTHRPGVVVVVDDGSTDRTPEKLAEVKSRQAFALHVIRLPRHEGSYVGRPELAVVFNKGLALLRDLSPRQDYVMILGGDHVLPPSYIEMVLARMESDSRVAVAAGRIMGEPFWEDAPRGSSMVVRADFWETASGLQFPENYGWESWLYLKAMQLGYSSLSLKGVSTHVARKTSYSKGILYGRAMYALGYYWAFALGRCLVTATHSPSAALKMWVGYFDHQGVPQLDVADWVGQMQRRALPRRALRLIARAGRK